jgi:hypothetical protein
MHKTRLPLVGAIVLLVAACTGTPAGNPGGSAPPAPSTPSSPSPEGGAIEHPTGAKDVILRYEEGGGFVMPAFLVTQAPIFTLYGDGTIVFRPQPADGGLAPEGGVIKEVPFRTARLSEDQIQLLLEFAISGGGLGLAVKDLYENPMIADAGTATFTIRAGGLDKQVGVYALGLDDPQVPDRALRVAFNRLAERLRTIDQGGSIPTEEYEPHAYRGVLLDGAGMQGPPPLAWPWPDIDISEFGMPGDEQGPVFPTRVMTPDEIAATGVTDGTGGFQGLLIDGPDGKLYAFAARPLLPDETS